MLLTPHNLHIREEDEVRMEAEDLKKREYHLIDSQRRQRGHTLYSFNLKTREIKVVEIKHEISLNIDGTVDTEKRVSVEQDCIYVQALNIKNCIKRLKRMGYSI